MIGCQSYPLICIIMFKNSILIKIAVFLLSFFVMIGEWVFADEIKEPEFFKKTSEESKHFFDSSFV